MTMPEVDTARWLMAVDAHPETFDEDLLVAAALVNDDPTGGAELPPSEATGRAGDRVEGVDPAVVTTAVEELIALGFLEVVLVDGDEHLLELRMP
jgi:hypothetical protein